MPPQKKIINCRSSIIASLGGREMRESVPSNTPSATAIQPLHRGSFYPDKSLHLVLRSATREKPTHSVQLNTATNIHSSRSAEQQGSSSAGRRDEEKTGWARCPSCISMEEGVGDALGAAATPDW